MRNARLASLAILGAATLASSGCAAASPDDDRIDVVAVTDVYGSIAAAIGGDLVDVDSIITGSAQDPHEYEATARDQLAVRDADLVIVNGGGYDDFMTRLLESSDALVVNASEASGLMPDDAGEAEAPQDHAADGHHHVAGFNEHVWYSIHGVEHVAERIGQVLTQLAPGDAEAIAAGTDAFLVELDALHDRVHALADGSGGGDVVSTEVVAAYLLEDLGLHDATPPDFAAAIEAGTGISARTLDTVLRSVERGDIRLLVVNPQSAGPEVELVREAARAAGVPVVEVTETLPADTDYLVWFATTLDALAGALQ